MTHEACESELTLSCEVIQATITRKLGDNRTPCRVLCPAAYAFGAGIKCRHCICVRQ